MTKTPDVEQVAQLLGMKRSEVVEVEQTADGVLAQTHDGNWTMIRDDGSFEFLGKEVPRAEVEAEKPAKAAPKGRGRA